MRWIVTDVPTWVVGVVTIVGLVVLALLAKLLIVKKTKWLLTDSHNDVAGFLVAIVAVVYAVIVGFTIVSLYEASVTANDDVSTEAANLLQLHDGNFVLGPRVADGINTDVVGYAKAVVEDWRMISSGDASSQVQKQYDDLYTALSNDKPRTTVQADYLNQAIVDVDKVGQARDARILEAKESGSLPLVLWIGILLTSAVTLGFALVFSLDNLRIAYLMVAGVASVLAVNLFVLVELGYPFLGTVAVGPGRFDTVIHIVGGG